MTVASRIMLIALVFGAAVFLFVAQPIDANGLIGDVNADGQVDIASMAFALATYLVASRRRKGL